MSEGKDDCWTFSGCDPSLSKINANFADLGRVCDLPNIPSANFPRVDADVSFPANWRINLTGDDTITITPEGSGSGGSGSGGSGGSGSSGSDSGSGSGSGGSGSGSDDPGGSGSGSGGSGSGSGSGSEGSGSGSGGSGSGSGSGGGGSGSGDSGSGSGGSGSGSGGSGSGDHGKKSPLRFSLAVNNFDAGYLGWLPWCEIYPHSFARSYNHSYVTEIDYLLTPEPQIVCSAKASVTFNGVVMALDADGDQHYEGRSLLLKHTHCAGNYKGYKVAVDRSFFPYDACDLSKKTYGVDASNDSGYIISSSSNGTSGTVTWNDFHLIPVAFDKSLLPHEITTEAVGFSSYTLSYDGSNETILDEDPVEELFDELSVPDKVSVPTDLGDDFSYYPKEYKNRFHIGTMTYKSFDNAFGYYACASTELTKDVVDLRLPKKQSSINSFRRYFVEDGINATTELEKYISNYAEYFKQHIFELDSNDTSNDVTVGTDKIFYPVNRLREHSLFIPSQFHFPSDLKNPLFYRLLTMYTMHVGRFVSDATASKISKNNHLKSFMLSVQLGSVDVDSDILERPHHREAYYLKRWFSRTQRPDGIEYTFDHDDPVPDIVKNYPTYYHPEDLPEPPTDQFYDHYETGINPDGSGYQYDSGYSYYYYKVYRSDDGICTARSTASADARAPQCMVWAKVVYGRAYIEVDHYDLSNDEEGSNDEEKTIPYGDFSYVVPYRYRRIPVAGSNNQDTEYAWVQEGTSVDVEILFDMPCIDWNEYHFVVSVDQAKKSYEDIIGSNDLYNYVLDHGPVEFDENPPIHGVGLSDATYEEVYKQYCITFAHIIHHTSKDTGVTLAYEMKVGGDSNTLEPAVYRNGKLHVYSFISNLLVSEAKVEITLSRRARLLSEEEAEKYYYFEGSYEDRSDKWMLDKRINGSDDALRTVVPKHPRLK